MARSPTFIDFSHPTRIHLFEPLPIGLNRLPDIDYLDDAWRRYERGPEHAGVLTHPDLSTQISNRSSKSDPFLRSIPLFSVYATGRWAARRK